MPGPYNFPTAIAVGTLGMLAWGDSVGAAFNEMTPTATPNVGVLRDGNGNAQFTDPLADQDAATKHYVDSVAGSSSVPDAAATSKGIIQLDGDLGGTAGSPQVVGIGGVSVASAVEGIGDPRWVQRSNLPLNAKADFGAKGDGVTDDTSALQAFVTSLTANGYTGFLPKGTYRITAPLNFSRRPGWRIVGEGAYNTIIRQDTDNTAILNIGSDTASTCHSWGVVGVQLTYLNTQASTNTAAVAMLFSQEVNNGFVRDVIFARGAYGIHVASGIGCPWGCSWDELRFGSEISIGAIDFSVGTNAVPNNAFGRMLITATAMIGPVLAFRGINMTIGTIEILQANLGPKLFQMASGGHVTIGAIKIENGTYSASQTLLDLQGTAKVKLGQFALYGTSLNISGATTKITAIGSGGGATGGWCEVGEISLIPTTLTGGAQLFAVSANNSAVMTVGYVDLENGSTLLDQGSTASAETTTVRSQVQGTLSQNLGDVNYTAVLGGPNRLAFSTAFTAARTIDLPTANNNLFNGLYYECIFNGAINGTNTATIRCNGTTLRTQTTDKAVVGYTYRRNPANAQGGWVQTKYETLP